MFASGKSAAQAIDDLGLRTIDAQDQLQDVIDAVIEKNPKPVADYRAGKQEAIKFLVGQAMRETRGRADPNALASMIEARLDGGA
jgi:aspartyl-tRNA(Asn)/glutamyl-tRNA(Gln) amidotransferase subunit B